MSTRCASTLTFFSKDLPDRIVRKMLTSANPEIRTYGASVLVRHYRKTFFADLVKLAKDPYPPARRRAIDALSADKRAIPTIQAARNDKSSMVRNAAIDALRKLAKQK